MKEERGVRSGREGKEGREEEEEGKYVRRLHLTFPDIRLTISPVCGFR